MVLIPWHRIFSERALRLGLVFIALACVPLSSRYFLPGAMLTLLLPVTFLGFLTGFGVVSLRLNHIQEAIILTIGGPLILFIYIGHLGPALAALVKETVLILGPLLDWLPDNPPVDPGAWMAAFTDLIMQIAVVGERIALWLLRSVQAIRSDDPVARVAVWSVGSWWLALWTGWQIDRQNGSIRALLPATGLLGFTLRFGSEQSLILWVHLAALLLALGLGSFERRLCAWKQAGLDYVESTWMYSLLSTIVLTMILISAAYLGSIISVRDILDRLREERRSSQAAQVGPGHTEPDSRSSIPPGNTGLLQPHRIAGGVKLSHDVVMIISTGDLPPMSHESNPAPILYYWRRTTYESYSGVGWTNSGAAIAEVPAGQDLLESQPAGYRLVRQSVRFPTGTSGALYWTNTLLRVDVPVRAAWRRRAGPEDQTDPFGGADLLSASMLSDAYSAESLRVEVSEARLQAAPVVYPRWVTERFLELPASIPERVLALAWNLTATEATPYDRALAIETYLRRIPYALEVPPPPLGQDAVDYFLFDLRKGYCDYYATAMVVLSRAAGLPARFVTGYASGSYDPEHASYLVTEADAHSWAEIYFPDIGWIEFEPTASQPLPSRQGQPQELPSKRAGRSDNLADQVMDFALRFKLGLWSLIAFASILLLAWTPAACMLLAYLRPAEAVGLFYRRLRRTARALTGPLPASQTAHEYAAVLSLQLARLGKQNPFGRWIVPAQTELDGLTDLYASSLFTIHEPDRKAVVEAARAWIRLRWRLLGARLLFSLYRRPL